MMLRAGYLVLTQIISRLIAQDLFKHLNWFRVPITKTVKARAVNYKASSFLLRKVMVEYSLLNFLTIQNRIPTQTHNSKMHMT